MKRPSPQCLALSTLLAASPLAAQTPKNCGAIPDFRVALTQQVGNGAVNRTVGFPATNQPGSPIVLQFRYDTTKTNKLALLTDPPGGTAAQNAPAYLRDADGLAFTGKELGNKRVNQRFDMQFQNCIRPVQLIGTPYGPRPAPARAAVRPTPPPAPEPKKDTVVVQPAQSINQQVMVNIIMNQPAKVDTVIAPPRVDTVYTTLRSTSKAQIGIIANNLSYSGEKNLGLDYGIKNTLTTTESRQGLGGYALIPYATIDTAGKATIVGVASVQRFGASGLDIRLRNPQGVQVAREDARFAFTDASVSVHPLLEGKLGARIGVESLERQITEIAAATPARPEFTSKNPTVRSTYISPELVLGPAAYNLSIGPTKHSLSEDYASGGTGWTAQLLFDGRLLTDNTIPVLVRARRNSVTGDDIETPNGLAPFKADRTTLQAQVAPIALVGMLTQGKNTPSWMDVLQLGAYHTTTEFKAGISQPESFTAIYIGAAVSFGAPARNDTKTPGTSQ
jgi:hypothetical protein